MFKSFPMLFALARNDRGVATVEFAFIAVVFTALVLGVTDAGQRIRDKQRLDSIASHLGDLITQETSLTDAKVASLINSVQHYNGKRGLGAEGKVYVSGVTGQASGGPKVAWQRSGAGTLSEASRVGGVGNVATLPAGLSIPANQTIIAVEVLYRHNTVLTTVGAPQSTAVRTAYMRGRKSELSSITN